MGHMKATRQGTRSTKKKNEDKTKEEKEEDEEEPLKPPQPHLERAINHQVACVIILTNDLKGTISIDLPG